jgi:hypothetical protein
MATEVNKIIFEIEITDKGIKRKIDGATVSISKFEKELKKASESTKQLNNELSGRAKLTTNAGLAGATLTELGRTISDSNYGIRGMANNLSQLSTLFITMIQKVDDNIKGFARLTTTLRMLGRELLGPLGIILAFQFVISRMEKADMEAKKTAEGFDKMGDSISDAGRDLKMLRSILERGNLSLEDAQIAVDAANNSYSNLNLTLDDNGRLTKNSTIALDNFILSMEKAAKATALLQQANSLVNDERLKQEEFEKKLGKIDEPGFWGKIGEELNYLGQFLGGGTGAGSANRIIKTREELKNDYIGVLKNQRATERQIFEDSMADIQETFEKEGLLASAFNKNRVANDKNTKQKLLDEIESFSKKSKELLAKDEFELLKIQREADVKRLELAGATEEQIFQVKLYYDLEYFKLLKEANDKFKKENEDYRDEVKKATEFLLRERIKEIKEFESIQKQMFSSLSTLLGGFSDVQKEIHQGNIDRINREKDLVLQNDELTQKEKERRLRQIESQEIAAQKRKIKSERDMFTLQQTLKIAQAALSLKLYLMEQTQEAELLKSKATGYSAEVTMDAEKNIAAGSGSIGKFVSVLGPIAGPIAYGAMIAGMIATIVKARKQAKNAIKNLVPSTNISDGSTGGGAAVQAPAFNVVGATQTSQLAQTIAGADDKPLRAYVVASDVSTAQELERSTIEGASIG